MRVYKLTPEEIADKTYFHGKRLICLSPKDTKMIAFIEKGLADEGLELVLHDNGTGRYFTIESIGETDEDL